jgi:TRAP-type C4-dicarboxylate transport system permease large subunit
MGWGLEAQASWGGSLGFIVMMAAFALLTMRQGWPVGVSLASAAWLGAALTGEFFPLRHLLEGAFSYLDPILVIATAAIFMRVLADGGALEAIGECVERRFRRWPAVLLPLLMLIVMFPGMITGSSTASVLTTGAMAAPILIRLGLRAERAAAFVAMAGILGMIAPPVNIPAMLIGGGLDLPYVGFTAPLLVASVPPALGVAFLLGAPLLRAGRGVGPVETTLSGRRRGVSLWRALVPISASAALMAAPRLWPQAIPDPGLPLIFLVSAAVGIVCSRRFSLPASLVDAIDDVLPVLGILTGVGAFIQVMTLNGARGWLVGLMLGAPSWALVVAAAVSLPLFGAISTFGAASVLGVPFLLAWLGGNEVITASALSLLTGLGDLMLPAAVAPTLAARVAGVDDRLRALRWCLVPAAMTAVVGIAMLLGTSCLGRWLG